jgi:hypothetical protein
MTPQLLRSTLRGNQQLARQQLSPLLEAPLLLAYALSDLLPEGASSASAAKLSAASQQLAGLPLLPLLDGTLGTLEAAAGAPAAAAAAAARSFYYLPSDQELRLLGSRPRLLVDVQALGQELQQQLLALAGAAQLNVRRVDAAALARTFLPEILPAAWLGKAAVRYASGAEGGLVNAEWLQLLWEWLGAQRADLGAFVGLPLLPAKGGKLCAVQALASSAVIRPISAVSVSGCAVLWPLPRLVRMWPPASPCAPALAPAAPAPCPDGSA